MSRASYVRDELNRLKDEGRILGVTSEKLNGNWRYAIATNQGDRLLWLTTSEAEAFVRGARTSEKTQ